MREIRADDLPAVAAVHLGSFPDSAMSRLGSATVERYYRWQLEGPHEKVWAVGAFLGGKCVGYSFSGSFNGSTSGFLSRNRGFLVRRVVLRPWLLLNGLFFDRVTSGVKLLVSKTRKTKVASESSSAKKVRSFGILSIAVSVDHQKLGIGKILMLDAEREALACNFDRMHLTVSPENSKAIRFYEGLGWVRKTEDGAWRGFMVKELASRAKASAVT